MKKSFVLILIIFSLLFISCTQELNSVSPNVNFLDKNTMKGIWGFVSATDGNTYGEITITSIGTNLYSPFENIWISPSAFPESIRPGNFAILVDSGDLKNIRFQCKTIYSTDQNIKTIELLECSDEISGIMKIKNVTDGIIYTYKRTSKI